MIDEAVAAIRAGKLVVLPTDTVYGLCADPYREAPAQRVARLKGRDEAMPIALLASDVDYLLECLPELRGKAGAVLRELLPGPYTIVAPNPGRRFRWLTGSRPTTIGVRVPVLPAEARTVVRRAGAVLATSANLHGEPDPRTLADVPEEIRAACAAVVDAGELAGVPSTVVDVTGDEPKVLREGAVPADEALARVRQALA